MQHTTKSNFKSIIISFAGIAFIIAIFFTGIITDPRDAAASENIAVPVRDPKVRELSLDAKAAASVWVSNDGDQQEILFAKNADKPFLIASLTKLMTADIVLEHENLAMGVVISPAAVSQLGYLKAGDVFPVRTLLYSMLIDSDNVAAYALSEEMGTSTFVALMKQKAKDLGLADTYYTNAVGSGRKNHSSANDLITLTKWLLENQPSVLAISAIPKFDIYGSRGNVLYKVVNTDPLVVDRSLSWLGQIVGSKTGKNNDAGGCLLLVVKSPNNDGYVISVILKSKNRFGEMKDLVNWDYSSYDWNT